MKNFTKAILAASTAIAVLAAPVMAVAEYPEKPVSFVVPWPPGDLEDVLTRFIAEDFQAKYGSPAAVVNKPGGGGGPFPGAIGVATAPADGYTIGSFIIAVPVVGPNIGIPELAPNPFEPLGTFLTYPFVIVAGADAPYDDIAGLAAHAKETTLFWVTLVRHWFRPKSHWLWPNRKGLNLRRMPRLTRWIATRWRRAMWM